MKYPTDYNKAGELFIKGLLHGLSITKEEIEADNINNSDAPYSYRMKFDKVIDKLKRGEYNMRFVMDTEYWNIKDYKKKLIKYDYKDTSKTDCPQYGDVTVEINTLEELLQLKCDVNEDIYIGNNDNGFEITIMDDQGDVIYDRKEEAKSKMNSLLEDVSKIITEAVDNKKIIESMSLVSARLEKYVSEEK